jgi:DNA uptake protein ComE-like DNA-binding protein
MTNNKQQTAVEWLIDKHFGGIENVTPDFKKHIEQAKEMQKQQKKECWDVAHQAGRFEGKGIAEKNWQTFEQYYNETYGGGQQ